MDLIPIKHFNLAAIDEAVEGARHNRTRNALLDMQMAEAQRKMAEQVEQKNALAEIYRTANGDQSAVLSAMSRDPRFAAQALDLQTKQAEIGSKTATTRKTNVEADKGAQEVVGRGLSQYIGRPDVTASQVFGMLSEMKKAGHNVDSYFSQIPTDPNKMQSWLMSTASIGAPVKDTIERFTPKVEMVDLGGVRQATDTNPLTNPGLVGKSLTKTMTPGEVASNQVARGNLAVAQGNLGLSRERLEMDRAVPKGTYDSDRGLMIGRDGVARPILKQDGSQLGAKPASANMSPTMQKELFEADDAVQSGKNVIDLLGQALKLNDKAYSGFGATTRAKAMSVLPGQSVGADATIELDNIITGQAMESLKSIFGGNPTEGERAILLDIQASPSKTPEQRAAIINRGIKAAEKRMNFAASKAESLRKGTYTTTGPVVPEAPATKGRSVDDLLKFYGGN
jgi:hypothetical protein